MKHLAALLILSTSTLHAAPPSSPLQPLPVANVQIRDAFWAPKLEVYRTRTIPHSWFYMQWELRSLRKAAGQQVEGDLNGTWGEANLHKFLETAALSLALHPDPALEKQLDDVIALLAAAQQPDGYLHAYVTNNGKKPWDPAFLDGSHDGYVLGHLIEAALEHHAATGKTNFLSIARKAADQAWQHFLGPNGQPGFCGHAELEMALVELHRATRDPRYLDLARTFLEWRGRSLVPPAGPTPRAYFQDAAPLRNQRTLDGHAVRAIFFATGVADLALETGDPDYRLATHRFWDSTTLRRMALTGSIGPRKEHEAFGEDYELPTNGYYESCAACGLADFAHRLCLLERRTESADVLERVLYNAVLHGISLDGTNTYYCNPLSDRDHPRDNCWVCCPPNLSRTLLQVGRYAYARSDHDLYVNLYVGSTARVPFPSGTATLHVDTDYPWDGNIRLRIESTQPGPFTLHLRKPGWCTQATLTLNSQPAPQPPAAAGYWTFHRTWTNGDTVDLKLDMPVQRMTAHPNLADCRGKVALQRGPLVYAFEGVDNPNLPSPILDPKSSFTVESRPDLLRGVHTLLGTSSTGQPIIAVPFYALANRGNSTQEVWVPQANLQPSDDWWLGHLYRALAP